MKAFVCEGCGMRDRDPLLPTGWRGYGMSARKPNQLAHWCSTCVVNGTMETFSVTTYRRAVAVAKSRGVLQKLKAR